MYALESNGSNKQDQDSVVVLHDRTPRWLQSPRSPLSFVLMCDSLYHLVTVLIVWCWTCRLQ